MNDTPHDADTQRKRSRNHVAGVIALLALTVVVTAWFWTTRQPAQPDAFGLPHGVMVLGVGACVAALVAGIRSMSLWDILDMLWEAILGLFWLVGAMLKGLVSFVCGLFGWD